MKVGSVLFAAGRGERLRPLTDRVAKPAVPILDVPLGVFGLAALAEAAPPVLVNVSHLGDDVIAALSRFADVQSLDESPEPFGTGGTLAAIRDLADERLITYNSDLLTDLDPATVLDAHRAGGALGTIALVAVESEADAMVSAGRVEELIDRRVHPDRRGARFIGIGVFEKPALSLLSDERPLDLARGLLRPLLERGELAAYVHDGYALDVGTVDRYVQASTEVLDGIGPETPGGLPGEIIDVEGGRAYIGPDAKVAGVLDAGAVVLRGATVEPGAVVARAVVWPGEHVPEGAELRDCVFAFGKTIRT